jgi:hypothetical protein
LAARGRITVMAIAPVTPVARASRRRPPGAITAPRDVDSS